MYKIGEFAKKTDLSVRTIRFYDEEGLLLPSHVDVYTNYRYYDEESIDQIKYIICLKDLGFSLEEIKHILKFGLTKEDIEFKVTELEELKLSIERKIDDLYSYEDYIEYNGHSRTR